MKTGKRNELLHKIASLNALHFDAVALEVFQYQSAHNPLYARFLELLGKNPASIGRICEIPCLPISLFKQYLIKTGRWTPEQLFLSSGTTGQIPSRHAVRSLPFYLDNARAGFESLYGPVRNYCVLALLPAYLERQGSSLVAMADDFIRHGQPGSGFFLHDLEALAHQLKICVATGTPTLLLGVSFALLDFAEKYPMDLTGVIVMETGGMKGRRKEITRTELHSTLKKAFSLTQIHSEYGMTELFSQAYSAENELFRPIKTLRAMAYDVYDPFHQQPAGKTGILHLIDLANIETCAFIATEDLGKVYADGNFEVLGRLDAAERRGCNLLAEM